jgi:UDP-N-acetylglucosamine diphosphorylase/glucosamine-1-phosphate N-acetyltransferase
MKYIIFEDYGWENFLPFTYTRITADMRVGVLKLRQRLGLHFDFEPNHLIIREELVDLYKERHPDWIINKFPKGEYCLLNSRLRANDDLMILIERLNIGDKLVLGDDVIACKISLSEESIISSESIDFTHMNMKECVSDKSLLWRYTWDFINHNGEMINEDFDLVFYEEDNFMDIEPGVIGINPYNIWIGEGVVLKQGVILDASDGPIIFDENAHIMHNAVLIGPVYIGKHSHIKVGSKIYPNTSIGNQCKIGGEVSGSIVQAFSNKQHDGFLGKSYIGEWVNIGADTNNSDLKNTYKPVDVWFYPTKTKISTENLFIGCFVGDHTKIGINCSINTGTVIGFGTNLFGKDLIRDIVYSFSWGEIENLADYNIIKFLETVKSVKNRRKVDVTEKEITLIKTIYNKKNINEGN